MNQQEAEGVLALMSVRVWPDTFFEAQRKQHWVEYLQQFNPSDAVAAVKVLEETTKFFPAISEFKEIVGPITRRRIDAEREEHRALEAAPKDRFSPAFNRSALSMVRDSLETIGRPRQPIIHPRYAPSGRQAEYAGRFHAAEHVGQGPANDCTICREFVPEEAFIPEVDLGPRHPSGNPHRCPTCREQFHLADPDVSELPACPNCSSTNVAMVSPISGLKYSCLECNVLYTGSYEEMRRYRDGTARARVAYREPAEAGHKKKR